MDTVTELFPADPPNFFSRVPYGYADRDQIRADLDAGGLSLSTLDRVLLRGHAASADSCAEGFCLGTPLRFALQERGPLGELTEAVAENLTRRLGDGPIDGELAAFVITAQVAGSTR
jgi:hypothetical protein